MARVFAFLGEVPGDDSDAGLVPTRPSVEPQCLAGLKSGLTWEPLQPSLQKQNLRAGTDRRDPPCTLHYIMQIFKIQQYEKNSAANRCASSTYILLWTFDCLSFVMLHLSSHSPDIRISESSQFLNI